MVTPWRTIKGAEPDAIKVASPVLNAGLRHEVVSVIVVLGVMPRHNPLSHQRYPTEMCGKVTTRTEPPDNGPTAHRLASKPQGADVSVSTTTERDEDGWYGEPR